MMTSYFGGFSLGFGLILAIGAQNAFVLRQGLRGQHVFVVCLICALSDAVLASFGVFGFGRLADVIPSLATYMKWGGALFLLFYGLKSFLSAWKGGESLMPKDGESDPLWPTVLTCLALTWLNPHVYLDTVVLIGSVASQFPDRVGFAAGAVSASFVFFFALGYGARLLRPIFARPMAWRILDVIIGLVMWVIAAKLVLT